MKKILNLIASMSLISTITSSVVACNSEKLYQNIELIYSYIRDEFINKNKVYYSYQEVINDFKIIVDSFNNEKIKITYNKNQQPVKNLFLVSIIKNSVVDRYTNNFLIKIYIEKNEEWSSDSVLRDDAFFQLNYGVKRDGIKLSLNNFKTNSGEKYKIKILNINELMNLKFSLNPFEKYDESIKTDEVEIWLENEEIIFIPKYNSFNKNIYIQANNNKNIKEIFGTEINIENNENDKTIILNDREKDELIYPANREITWELLNNKETKGMKRIYSEDSNFKIISIDNDTGLIKAIYNSNNNDIKVENITIVFIPNNPEYQILYEKINIYPDNLYWIDEQGKKIPEMIEFPNDVKKIDLSYSIKNYDSSLLVYFKETDSYNDFIFDYNQKNGKIKITSIRESWEPYYDYSYSFYFERENIASTSKYYNTLEINIRIHTIFEN